MAQCSMFMVQLTWIDREKKFVLVAKIIHDLKRPNKIKNFDRFDGNAENDDIRWNIFVGFETRAPFYISKNTNLEIQCKLTS